MSDKENHTGSWRPSLTTPICRPGKKNPASRDACTRSLWVHKQRIYSSGVSTASPTKNEITNSIENFVTGNAKLKIPIDILALPLNQGGYKIPNISLCCDLLFLKLIAEYWKKRKEEKELSDEMAFTEYNIGLQLANLLTLPPKNHLPHAIHLSRFYSCPWLTAENTN